MSTWNYRLVRYQKGLGYGLHEVHYDGEGLPWAMTTDPIHFSCGDEEGPEGVIHRLTVALKDAMERDVFDEPTIWPGKNPGA